jgi:hypothetical protein
MHFPYFSSYFSSYTPFVFVELLPMPTSAVPRNSTFQMQSFIPCCGCICRPMRAFQIVSCNIHYKNPLWQASSTEMMRLAALHATRFAVLSIA